MRSALLASALALASCGQAGDDYAFERAEFDRRSQAVTVIEHPTLAALHRAAPPEAIAEGRELHGFSYLRPSGCEIHVTDLRNAEARLWLGHEMTHCVYGRWHD